MVYVFHPFVDFSIAFASTFGMPIPERFHLLAKFPFESLGLITTASPGVFFNLPPNFDDVSFEFFVFFRIALAMLPLVVVAFPFTIWSLSSTSFAVLVAFSVPISFTPLFAFSTSVISFLAPPVAVTCFFSRAFAVFRFGELSLCSGFLRIRFFRV
ncbi:MAG: hypothetical protein ACKVHE_21200 [Planctomycetales bacterium]